MKTITKGYRPIAIQESILTIMHKMLLKELPLPKCPNQYAEIQYAQWVTEIRVKKLLSYNEDG